MVMLSHTKKYLWEHRSHTCPPHYHPGHVTSPICKDNWWEFKSLWLGFKIRVYGQGVGSMFKLRGSAFKVRV